jgi:hypothetical protein
VYGWRHALDVNQSPNPPTPGREALERCVSSCENHLFLGMLISISNFSPVGLKEAALDSPTFRATTLHFSDQVEFIEKWLDGYAKAATKLSSELTALESVVSSFLSYSTHPLVVSEAVVDHDYTLLAMRRCGEGSKDLWNGLITTTRKLESLISEPIRDFIQEDLRHFKVGDP